jgi:hypothetical protein
MTGEEVLKAGERSLGKSIKVLVTVVVGIVLLYGLFAVTRTVSHGDTCVAVGKTNTIFEEFVRHQRQKSIQNVEAGITSSTTSIKEIEDFYKPTITAINHVSC